MIKESYVCDVQQFWKQLGISVLWQSQQFQSWQGFPLVSTVVVSRLDRGAKGRTSPAVSLPRSWHRGRLAALGRAGFLPLRYPGKQNDFGEGRREVSPPSWNRRETFPPHARGQQSYLLEMLANSRFLNWWGCWGCHHWNPTLRSLCFPAQEDALAWCGVVGNPLGCIWLCKSALWDEGGSAAGKKQEIKEESVLGWPSMVREKALVSADSLEICQSFLLVAQRGLGIIAPWPGDLLPCTRSHPGHNKSSLLTRAAKAIEKGEGSS